MRSFYFRLWLAWALRVTLESLAFGVVMAGMIVLFIYTKKGLPALDAEVGRALGDLFLFWFSLSWSVALLLSLFRSLKYIFNRCFGSYKLQLLTCDKQEEIEPVGYGDLLRVWRRWLMLLIWSSAVFIMLLALVMRFLFGYNELFSWLNIYVLYGIILVSGYTSLVLLMARCKKTRIGRC